MRYINYLRRITAIVASAFACAIAMAQTDPNSPGIIEPCLTATMGLEVRIPNTDQAEGDELLNVVGRIVTTDAQGATSLTAPTSPQISSYVVILSMFRSLVSLASPETRHADGER